jgi:RNA polymerase sigma-70 factor (ECF subfamily)
LQPKAALSALRGYPSLECPDAEIVEIKNNYRSADFSLEETRASAQPMNVDNEIDRQTPPPDAKDGVIDADLLKRSAAGDGTAFHQLVDRHGDRLFRLAKSLVGNAADAEDVLQEAFAGAFRGAGKFEGRSSVKSWLTRIVITQAAKFWRSRRGKRDQPLEGEIGSGDGGAAAVDAKLDLNACLKNLSEEHRQVLVLREIDGMAYDEMAEVLGVPRGTVESRLFRARAELKKRLKDYL